MEHLTKTGLFFILAVFCWGTAWAAPPPQKTKVPWDSVAAQIQMIKNVSKTDSIRQYLLKSLFERYQIRAEDYQRFYDNFLKKPIEDQQAFIDRMRRILQEINQPIIESP